MIRFTSALAIALAVIALPLAEIGHIAQASGGNNTAETVALHRQACAATTAGPTVGTARISLDDQGGGNVNPNGIEILASVTAGMPRTSYNVEVVGAACQVLVSGGTLTTDDSGRGDFEFHVLGSVVPPGTNVRVQLLASTDAITSDLISAP